MPRPSICFQPAALGFVVALVAVVASTHLHAQVDWTNTTGGSAPWFDLASNWSTGSTPGSTDNIRFRNNGNFEVWWDTTTAGSVPEVNNLDVDFTVSSSSVLFLNRNSATRHSLNTNVFSVRNGTQTIRGLDVQADFVQVTGTFASSKLGRLILDGSHSAGTSFNSDRNFNVSLGELSILNGASLSSAAGGIFRGAVEVSGGSSWDISGLLETLDVNSTIVESGGMINAGYAEIDGDFVVTGLGSELNISGLMTTGLLDPSSLNIEAGGLASIGGDARIGLVHAGSVTVADAGSQLSVSGDLFLNQDDRLDINTGGRVLSQNGIIGPSGATSFARSTANINGAGSRWDVSNQLRVGAASVGGSELNVTNGGVVTSNSGIIADQINSPGTVTVSGTGSLWENTTTLIVGHQALGQLNINDGGVVNSGSAVIGEQSSALNVAHVGGAGSRWDTGELTVGNAGVGELNISDNAEVNSTRGFIATQLGSFGRVSLESGGRWNMGDLAVGADGTGRLDIDSGGLVSVSGTTSISTSGSVFLTGGTFQFGNTSLIELTRVDGTGGAMAGNVNHESYTDVSTLDGLQRPLIDMTDVVLTNSGVLYGDAALGSSVINLSTGELQAVAGERLRFAGRQNINFGEINNYGGQIRFEQDVVNFSGGLVGGRGQFVANGGWRNEGVMAFSGGFTDIVGDVENLAGGQIVVAGGAVATFFDDLVHNGAEIRTAGGSHSVFFGDVSGSGSYTGAGTVSFEGDLRPGSSPGIVSFDGNVILGSGSMTQIEIYGMELGEFDRLSIGGDLNIDGSLQIDWNVNDSLTGEVEFLFAEIGGSLQGEFAGLTEGDLVGTFDGIDLFISYSAGDGNDIALFSAIPEPSSALLLMMAFPVCLMHRRRRSAE